MDTETAVTFWGLRAEGWTAVGTVGLAIITALLAIIAWDQSVAIRNEARRNRTLLAVDRYDFDPILDKAQRKLANARDRNLFDEDPKRYRIDITTLLNYLESIAIGIETGIYDEGLAKTHLRSVLIYHYEEYLGDSAKPIEKVEKKNYVPLTRLYRKWSAEPE